MRALKLARTQRRNPEHKGVLTALKRLGIDIDAEIWILSGQIRSRPINWSTFLLPLAGLSLPAKTISRTLRWLAACWLTGVGGECNPHHHNSVMNDLRLVRRFLKALLTDNHVGLETVTPGQAQAAVRSLYFDQNGVCSATVPTLRMAIQCLHDLHRLRGCLPTSIAVDPFPVSYLRSLYVHAKRSECWTAPPEPVCLELIRQAIRMLGPPADEIVQLRRKYITACESAKTVARGIKAVNARARASLRGARFTTLPGESYPWTPLDAQDPVAIKILSTALEGACALLLLFLSGPRASEVRRAAPGCLRYFRHENGIEYPYFFAERSKQTLARRLVYTDHSANRGWILGPFGVRALEVLADLSEPLRTISRLDSYWLAVTCTGLWTCSRSTRITMITPARINSRLNAFAEWIQLYERTGWQGHLHSHMGRKACARFIAKRDRTALADLAVQFGHLSAYITDIGYARPDAEYRRLVDEELAEELQEVAADLAGLDLNNTFSNVGREATAAIRDRAARFIGELRSKVDVRRLLGAGVRLVPCDWGMCVYREETSACGGNRFGPSDERRSPIVCVKCMNFLATPKHRPFWQRRINDCEQVLAHRGLPEQTSRLVRERLGESQAVLAAISNRIASNDTR